MDVIVVVDDRPDTLAGRVSWLARLSGVSVIGLSFIEALDPRTDWSEVTLAVLDGRDDRLDDWVSLPGPDGQDRSVPDRYLGVRVAERIRSSRRPDQTRIVLISAYARDNDFLARRCQQAGVDFLYSVYELHDAQDFMDGVLNPAPEAAPDRLVPPDRWRDLGLRGTPDFATAIREAESNPAGAQVAFDLPGRDFPGAGHHQRKLRELLGSALKLRERVNGGPRETHPSKREISTWLRRAFGYGDCEPVQGPEARYEDVAP